MEPNRDDMPNIGEKDIPDRQNTLSVSAKRFGEKAKKLEELMKKKNENKANLFAKLMDKIVDSDTSSDTTTNNNTYYQDYFRCIKYAIIGITIYNVGELICKTIVNTQ